MKLLKERNILSSVRCIIHNSQKAETAQVSISRWMGQQHVDVYNGILLSHDKEWSFGTSYNVVEVYKHYAEWRKPDTRGQIRVIPLNMKYPKQTNSETESRLEVTRDWEEGVKGSDCFTGAEVLFGVMQNFGNRWWWCLCNIRNVFGAAELYTEKWQILCYAFYHNKKENGLNAVGSFSVLKVKEYAVEC